MKCCAFLSLALLGSVAAFAPSPSNGRVSTAREALADRIFGMDLFVSVQAYAVMLPKKSSFHEKDICSQVFALLVSSGVNYRIRTETSSVLVRRRTSKSEN